MKSHTNISICLLIVLIIALVTGCGHNPPPSNNDPPSPLAKLDLSNATALAIISNADVKRSSKFGNRQVVKDASSENLIFKILPDGTLAEVQLLDANGNPINYGGSYNPVYINNVNENYILVCFGNNSDSIINIDDSYLVRKSDGAVYSLEKIGRPYVGSYWRNIKPVQTDSQNNIYYATFDNFGMIIMKINTQDINNLYGTRASAAIDSWISYYELCKYIVDLEGNLVYSAVDWPNSGVRLVHANGQFEPIISCWQDFWLGLDNKFYYVKYDETHNKHVVYRIDFIGPNAGQYEQHEVPISGDQPGYAWIPAQGNCNQVTVGNKIFRISNGDWNTAAVYEIYNGVDVHKVNLITDINKIYFSGASSNCYYLCGIDASNKYLFARVDTDGNVTQYTDPNLNGLEVYSMIVSDSGEILFNADKYTGEKIIGKIDASGNLVSEDASLNTTVIQLERIQ